MKIEIKDLLGVPPCERVGEAGPKTLPRFGILFWCATEYVLGHDFTFSFL